MGKKIVQMNKKNSSNEIVQMKKNLVQIWKEYSEWKNDKKK